MKKKTLILVFLFASFTLPAIAEGFALPSFYTQMDNSVGILFFDNDLVPEAYQGGHQLNPAARIIGGVLAMPFPFSIEASLALQVPKKKLVIRDLLFSYFSEFSMVSIGKQKTDWGIGNIFRPLYYLKFVTDPYAKHLIGRDSPRVWQANFNYYTSTNTLTLKGFVEDSLIEKLNKPDWWSLMLQDEMSFSNFTITGQAAYLYKENDPVFTATNNSCNCGVEAKWTANNFISVSLAQSASAPIDFSDFSHEGTIFFELLCANNEVFFSPEIGYKKNEPLIGLSFGYSPQTRPFAATCTIQYDMNHPGIMLYVSTDVNVSEEVTLLISGNWTHGKNGSIFAQKEVPLTLMCALQANIY